MPEMEKGLLLKLSVKILNRKGKQMPISDKIHKGRKVRKPRLLVLGTAKAGKSTFCAGSDKPIFMPIQNEEGIDDLDVDSYPVATTYDELLTNVEELENEDYDYQTLVIDSASTLEPLIMEHLLLTNNCDTFSKVGGGYGAQFTELCKAWDMLLYNLDRLRDKKNMTVCIIGHVVVKTVQDPLLEAYDKFIFDISPKTSAVVEKWCDAIVFATQKVTVQTVESGFNKTKGKATPGKTRQLITRGYAGCPADGRGVYGHLPPTMDLEWDVFKNEVILASKERNK